MSAGRFFRTTIAKQVADLSGCSQKFVASVIERPKNTDQVRAEFAIPLPRLLKAVQPDSGKLTQSQQAEFGQQLAAKVQEARNPFIATATPLRSFLNFRPQPLPYISHILKDIHEQKEAYGSHPDIGKSRTVVIDFSSPNIAKPFHVGHLRSTILGAFCKRICMACGWNVVALNYLGDWGKQYGILAVGYEKYGSAEALANDPIRHLYDVYVKISADATTDPSVDDAAKDYFRRMEEGDEKALETWRHFRDLSIDALKEVYKRIRTSFECYSGESTVGPWIPQVFETLEAQGLLSRSDTGALGVDLSRFNLGFVSLRRNDGTTLYATRDIASAMARQELFHFDRALYVVGSEQEHYMQQLYKIVEWMFEHERAQAPQKPHWSQSLEHIKFGRIMGMSTRKGTAIFLDDILDAAREHMLALTKENEYKYAQLVAESQKEMPLDAAEDVTLLAKGSETPEDIAEELGLSAVVIQDLASRRVKDYEFNWSRMTDSRGDTGVYLQYAYARLCGIERKSDVPLDPEVNLSSLIHHEQALELANILSQYPEVVEKAYHSFEPHLVVQYLMTLAHAISSSQSVLRVKGMEGDVGKARRFLFWAARTTMGNGLRLVGLEPLERM
ncbi:hypothetical protein BZG36_03042 [Bifiguratus adelaidae]|uniref:arginine--tRNA ligase n=1 Tax=Bifiguratus adelaidae TaxID=1938954 RepID=A0A261XZ96_9FUNG|nr:hypothetical protein BZG36_03042 [Bifiguratus adelaidae]